MLWQIKWRMPILKFSLNIKEMENKENLILSAHDFSNILQRIKDFKQELWKESQICIIVKNTIFWDDIYLETKVRSQSNIWNALSLYYAPDWGWYFTKVLFYSSFAGNEFLFSFIWEYIDFVFTSEIHKVLF